MKPDGVATAALEPMETLESNPVNEAAAPTGQEPNPATAAVEEETPQQPVAEMSQAEPRSNQPKETPGAKTSSTASGDAKAKTANKVTIKTKGNTTNSPKTSSGPRSTTSQSRISNGTSKPQTNGVAKKTTPAAEKKSTPTSASSKKPAATTGAPASKSTTKVGEKKAPGVSPYINSTKSSTGAPAAKKTPSSTANGVKPSPTGAAAKKPPAAKPAAPSKTTAAASTKPDKPPVSKTTRPTVGTSVSSRPATGSSHSASATKNSTAASKTATPKTTSSTTTKTATPKSTSTTPSGGKPPVSQTSRNTTPVKKDLTKPATPAAKKLADSPLSRPSSTTKPAKAETPKPSSKTNVATKKPTPNKATETKTPNRSKPQENKSTPSKDASKPATTKTAKTPITKKTVGSSTPTPVKRAPKAATTVEPGKEVAAAVAAAAAAATIATAASVALAPEETQLHAGEAAEPSAAVPETVQEKTPESTAEPKSEPVCEPAQDMKQPPIPQTLQELTPEPVRELTPEPVREPTPEPVREPTPEPVREPTPEPVRELTPEPVREPTPEPVRELTPEPVRELTPEPVRERTPEPVREPTPEPVREPTPEPVREPTPEPVRELTPEPVREPTPEPVREPTPEPVREITPELVRELTPEPVREPTPEPVREPTPEPVREQTPEPVREPTPEPVREPTTQTLHEPSSVRVLESSPESSPEPRVKVFQPSLEAEQEPEPASTVQMAAQVDPFKFEDNSSVPSLGTTVMSPPCSPPGPASPVRESHNLPSLLDMDVQSDPWDRNQASAVFTSQRSDNMMEFQTEEEKENKSCGDQEEEEQEEEEDKENLFLPTSTASGARFGASPLDHFTHRDLVSSQEKEEASEKADEEINEDDDEEEDEDEDLKRPDHLLSSLTTDMSTSQPSDEILVRSSAFGGSAGWHGDDLLSGMDSEDVSSCTSSRQQGVSDLSSTQHTAILEGTQSSDALVDSSFRGSEGDGNLMGSPNVETIANEEEEDEDEDDDRVDDIDMSSEQVEEHHPMFQEQKQDEEEDEDVEMHSEGVIESCGIVDDDFNDEEHLDQLSHSGPQPCVPAASSWGQTNPFSDTWAQPASLLPASSPSPVSDHDAAESETPTQSPAQACIDIPAPSFPSQPAQTLHYYPSEQVKDSAPEETHDLLAASVIGMSQSSATALATHSSSETSTPEDLRDYDSSSGVESHSDKQQTPVPASLQPDMEQDLGIHLEKGDGEEEEAETLPADEVLGTGPPTAPASDPSSPSTSGDEASDTEGEIQINDPEAPMMMDERAGFESPPPSCSLTALEEDEEAGDIAGGEGEEDGGGATPQSANSVASYGFDCTTSNSNAHSMAESCGKSPGIFSLENEEQLPEEAKNPSLIKELTLPSAAAAAQAEDLLGNPVDLIPLSHPEDNYPSLDHYMLGGKMTGDHLEEFDPLEGSQHLGGQESEDPDNSQPPYYSTICDKTDSFLEGNV